MALHLVTEGSLSRHERDVLLHWLASNFVDSLQLSIAVAFVDVQDESVWLADVIRKSFHGDEDSAAMSLWGLEYRDNAEEAERREELIKKLLMPLIRQRVMNDLS